MVLTGKAKEDFEKWFNINIHDEQEQNYYLEKFQKTHASMQYGVLVDWFDSVGIRIFVHDEFQTPYEFGYKFRYAKEISKAIGAPNKFETRREARAKAIKSANGLYNDEQ